MSESNPMTGNEGAATAPVIELTGVWKVFGERGSEALAAIREEGLDKAAVLERIRLRDLGSLDKKGLDEALDEAYRTGSTARTHARSYRARDVRDQPRPGVEGPILPGAPASG